MCGCGVVCVGLGVVRVVAFVELFPCSVASDLSVVAPSTYGTGDNTKKEETGSGDGDGGQQQQEEEA